VPATPTTPDPVQLNMIMREMADSGCDYAFMRSVHIRWTRMRIRIEVCRRYFYNLTHDHLDYHKTFDNYLAAKKKFFDSLLPDAFALANSDDRNGKVMLQNCRQRDTCSHEGMADFRLQLLNSDSKGWG